MDVKKYFKGLSDSELRGMEYFADEPLLTNLRKEINRRIVENEQVEDSWKDRKNTLVFKK